MTWQILIQIISNFNSQGKIKSMFKSSLFCSEWHFYACKWRKKNIKYRNFKLKTLEITCTRIDQVIRLQNDCNFSGIPKASWSRSNEHPVLGSSFNDISPKPNFENQFLTLQSVIGHKHYKFSSLFQLFLNSHDVTCQICTVISSILGAWDHRLNCDARSLTNEIRFSDKGTLLSANFRLRLKDWKFEMCNKNLLLKNGNYPWLNPIWYIFLCLFSFPYKDEIYFETFTSLPKNS